MDTAQITKQFALFRIFIGAAAWLAPSLAGRAFGLDPKGNPQAPYLARLFGARDIALGVGTLTSEGEARRRWVLLGAFCDLLDAGAGVLGGRDGYLPKPAAAMVTAPALAGVAVGVAAATSGD